MKCKDCFYSKTIDASEDTVYCKYLNDLLDVDTLKEQLSTPDGRKKVEFILNELRFEGDVFTEVINVYPADDSVPFQKQVLTVPKDAKCKKCTLDRGE